LSVRPTRWARPMTPSSRRAPGRPPHRGKTPRPRDAKSQ
jgi:hypothetical protein